MLSHKTDFERLIPTRHREPTSISVVRVTFQKMNQATDTKPESYKLKMYIGKEVARKLQWNGGDRIAVEISKSDPRVIRLVKVPPSDLQSYKIATIKGQYYFIVALSWKKFEPSTKECLTKIAQHAYSEGGLIIYLH